MIRFSLMLLMTLCFLPTTVQARGFHHGPGPGGPGPGFDPWFWSWPFFFTTAVILDNDNPPPPVRDTTYVVVQPVQSVQMAQTTQSSSKPTAARIAVAVPNLSATSLDTALRNDLSQKVRADLASSGYQALYAPANTTCLDDPDCLLRLGRSIGAKILLAGSVIPMDSSWQMSLRFINLQNGQIETLVTETVKTQLELYPTESRLLQKLINGGKTSTVPTSSARTTAPVTSVGNSSSAAASLSE
ncbi:MAG TPA: hypothetical protein VLM37_13715 [Fibrobacteraceae bacterium]|nr:hypothetical protein [Fibrobacteraceae bacterium]